MLGWVEGILVRITSSPGITLLKCTLPLKEIQKIIIAKFGYPQRKFETEMFADGDFWKDIQNNENSQMACPWTNKKNDTLREELFYYSLMLHKAFVLNSKAVRQNINCLINCSNGNLSERNKASSYAHLLNTLLLIVPVVSTTFCFGGEIFKTHWQRGVGDFNN